MRTLLVAVSCACRAKLFDGVEPGGELAAGAEEAGVAFDLEDQQFALVGQRK